MTARPLPTEGTIPALHVRMLACARCGRTFPYRYTGSWRPNTLPPVERLCMPCFTAVGAQWRAPHPKEEPTR